MKNLDDAIALTNQLAPEHCEVMTRQPQKVSEKILTAGAIFLGNWSPTVLGDYVAGPSHVLPTDGAGASFAGLTVDQFQRRTSVMEYNRASFKRALKSVKKFAELEGLGAHGKSAEIRTRFNMKMKSASILILACALLIQGCEKSSDPSATRQKELARILKPLLKREVYSFWGEEIKTLAGWANRRTVRR